MALSFKLFYYFYGEDTFRRDKEFEKLKTDLEIKDTDFITYEGKKIDTSEIVNLARTVCLFSSKRLILIKNAKIDWDIFKNYFENPVEGTYVVFVSSKCSIPKKFKSIFEKKYKIVAFNKIKTHQISSHIKKIFASYNREIGVKDISLIVSYLGDDLEQISNEIRKLMLYVEDRDIKTKDIELVLEKSRVGSVFELLNFIFDKQIIKGLNLLDKLLESGQGEFAILALFVNQFFKLHTAKKLMYSGVSSKVIGDRLSIPFYFIKDILKRAKNFSWEDIERLSIKMRYTEHAFKYKKTLNRILLERLFLEVGK